MTISFSLMVLGIILTPLIMLGGLWLAGRLLIACEGVIERLKERLRKLTGWYLR